MQTMVVHRFAPMGRCLDTLCRFDQGRSSRSGQRRCTDRAFGATKLPCLIASLQVTTIEGTPRQTLAKVVAAQGAIPIH